MRQRTARQLGTQVAEVDKLYAAVLAAPGDAAERLTLAQLAHGGTRLAVLARRAVDGDGPAVVLSGRYRTRLRRRVYRAGRVADRITAWAQRGV
ncbi:hypothetical protein GXW82_18060 [Streptacidiphilus sp. 4-A2]|nr:hypothetical protein [Streptacidiphilus sp. 4-A2]